MSKKILIAASNYWNSPYQVGSHHYARIFAKNGWKVLFVSDPISPFHLLLKNRRQLRGRYKIYKGLVKSKPNIIPYVPFAFLTPNEKPMFNSMIVTLKWYKMTIPNLIKYAKSIGFGEVDLLWFDSIVQYFWIKEIKYRKSILRIADRIDAFKKINKNLKKIETTLMESVDNIIYTADSLREYLSGYEDKMRFISNGVNIDHFIKSQTNIPGDYENIPKPRVIYIGAIEEWFDVDLLFELASNREKISFVIIGDPGIDLSKLSGLRNVHLLGRKKYKDIPSYLFNSDVGIIPFKNDHPIVDSINPIKLYEYMACGLPVVAIKWKELENIKSPAYLAKGFKDFMDGIDKALIEKNEGELKRFALSNSWESRYSEVMKLMK